MIIPNRPEHASFSSSSPTNANMSPINSAWIPDEHARNQFLKKYETQVSSAAATVLATLAVAPLDNVKTRMQTHNFKNVFQCTKYMWRNEGPRGFVAGSLPPLVSVTAVRVVNFTIYHRAVKYVDGGIESLMGTSPLEELKKSGNKLSLGSVVTFTAAGSVAGLVAAPIACPFELAKNVVQTSVLMSNRAQAAPDAARDPSLRTQSRLNTVDAIKQIVRRHGFRGLYTGFHLHALRDFVGTGLYFGVYETVKQVASKELGENKSPAGAPLIAGALCSTAPWVCTYPLDTRKTRAQSVLLGKSKEIGELSVAAAKSGMYKGLPILMLRTSINNMILLSMLEYLKARIAQLPE